ncbi:cutinase transcription factor 1 alpha [Dactylonectria estremocensis]|uniref:Cutinase transcription factor 1 alpha n=1 Tax=Dactylonectria estremocensis TaxID=1079267 RepID=A0A9P9DTQ0_9HYPO|nr:cutinase transcription factor 1 alpha [Dactylonectria estremocensis]
MNGPQATSRCRAKRACRRCNGRRVKCNVMETLPCDNCIQANALCEVPESRRGKRARPPASASDPASARLRRTSFVARADVSCRALGLDGENPTRPERPDRPDRPDSISSSSEEQRLPSLTALRRHTCESSISIEAETSTPRPCSSADTEINVAAPPPPSPPRPDVPDEDGELFLGESATLRCVYDDRTELPKHPSPEDNARLKFSLPQPLVSEAALPEWEAQRKERRIKYLRDEGVFDMPPDAVSSILLKEYFRWFHPCFPIVDREDVVKKWAAKTLSPLLTMAILSVAAAHSDDKVLADAGFVDRQRARYIFYSRAKDLYEVDYETNKTTVIQAVFLVSFWRSGRLLDKHTRHWLGIAITLAQSKAMHRCFPISGSLQARLRRRIWWSIYIRECQCSASLGLPVRVRDSDCDVEPLKPTDMDDAASPGQQLVLEAPPQQLPAEISYVVEMAKLAPLLSRIIDLEYSPRRTMDTSSRQQLKERLLEWEDQLPKHLSPHVRLGESLNLHAAMLHLAYNNLLILLFRNTYIHNGTKQDSGQGNIALQAAARNSSVIEDILARGLMRHADIHLINSLFNTLCIHVVHLRRSAGTVRSVTEHRARLCLLGLQELQKTWQVTIWALQLRLFFQALDKATTDRLRVDDDEACSPGDAVNRSTDILPPATSILPELWRLGHPNSASDDQLPSPDFDQLLADGNFSEVFGWTTEAEGLGGLVRQLVPMQMEQDFSFQDLIG